MSTRQKEIEEYALGMVLDGARHCVQDDLNEDEELGLSEEEWAQSRNLAKALIKVISERRDDLLALAQMEAEWQAEA